MTDPHQVRALVIAYEAWDEQPGNRDRVVVLQEAARPFTTRVPDLVTSIGEHRASSTVPIPTAVQQAVAAIPPGALTT